MEIQEVAPQLAQKLDTSLKLILHDLHYSIPDHYRAQVSLVDAKGRKKRRNASADNWSYTSDRIEIWFEPCPAEDQSQKKIAATTTRKDDPRPSSPSTEVDMTKILVKALDQAESTPGWKFVPLKKFRDEILASERTERMCTDVERQNVLRSAIEKRLILLGKVPNPKAPEFPVTTIRLNRLLPEVRRLLGESGNPDSDFDPIEIRGEPLSQTILRERR